MSKKVPDLQENVERINPYYFGKLIIKTPVLCVFMALSLVGYSTEEDVMSLWKNFKAQAKLRTLKQFLERSWYYDILCLTSIDTKYFFSNTFFSSIDDCCCVNYHKLYNIYQIVWNYWNKSSRSSF